jgi:hypothetical protein
MSTIVHVGTGDNEKMAINTVGSGSWSGSSDGGSAEHLAKVKNRIREEINECELRFEG